MLPTAAAPWYLVPPDAAAPEVAMVVNVGCWAAVDTNNDARRRQRSRRSRTVSDGEAWGKANLAIATIYTEKNLKNRPPESVFRMRPPHSCPGVSFRGLRAVPVPPGLSAYRSKVRRRGANRKGLRHPRRRLVECAGLNVNWKDHFFKKEIFCDIDTRGVLLRSTVL